jgi:CheY-like chemotaxis protein/anti-sigma regulatory factor (Ser/Thr protein kinase)
LFKDFKPKAEQRKLRLGLNKELSDTEVMIRGDLVKLKQIIGNLIENAIKFTDSGGVDVSYSRAGENLIIAVKDTGIGIEEHEKQLIFDHFRQTEITMARKYGGMGLGLSISNAYIRMMSGVIRVESKPGAGSIFYVEIPYLPAVQASNNHIKIIQPPVISKPDWQNKTLLVAEDEESNVQFLKAVLRSTGIKILIAVNGLEAVEYCRTHPEIIVVLMDIKMPRMDGIDATKIIKSFRKDLPVIATTAFALTGEREYILGAGCDDYLPKPITRELLISKIHKQLSGLN